MFGATGVDVGRDLTSIAASSAIVALIVTTALAAVAALLLAGRHTTSWSAAEWFAGLGTVALVASVTLFRDGIALRFDPARLADWSTGGLRTLGRDPLGSSQLLLNVVLFVPAGAAWAWLTSRPARVVGALALGSVAVECAQAVTGAGANDLADVVTNTLGAALGAAVVVPMTTLRRRPGEGSPRRRATRPANVAVGGVLVLVLVSAWFVGASRRQSAVANELAERFGGTTRADVLSRLESDPETVFSAIEDRADGVRYTDDEVLIRYPAAFFGLHRCVFVIWSVDGVELRDASGDDCTRFLG